MNLSDFKVELLQKSMINPGDVFVLTTDRMVTKSAADEIKEKFSKMLKEMGFNNNAFLLHSGLKLEVISSSKEGGG